MARLYSREDFQRTIPDMSPAPGSNPWYAVITNPNCEHQAADNLQEVCRPYFPRTASLVKGGGPRKLQRVSERALFPRYVFVCNHKPGMFPFFALRGVRGVESIVRVDGYPMPIPESVIAAIREREEAGEFDFATPTPPKRTMADHGLTEGQQMRIKSGPFEGWLATIEGLAKAGSEARLVIEMLGQVVRARVPVADLDRVA
jgi:transcription antitermination factor NusG